MQMKAVTVLDFSMFIPIGLLEKIPHQVYTGCKTREKSENVAESIYKIRVVYTPGQMLITKELTRKKNNLEPLVWHLKSVGKDKEKHSRIAQL